MADLRTSYMGIGFRNPLILGSSSLSSTIDSLKKAEDSGIGGIVLKSIFEEQITNRTDIDMKGAEDYLTMGDARLFLEQASRNHHIDRYLDLVRRAKESLDIPVIASINCTDEAAWLDYSRIFAACGADAVELNYYQIAGDVNRTSQDIEKNYVTVAQKTAKLFGSMPVSMKLSWHFTSISNIVNRLSQTGIKGVVLFNHFFRPDIDIQKVAIDSDHAVQPKGDYSETLRWTAMLASEVPLDFCASTGIRDYSTVVKMLLAGARTTQLTSVIYEKGWDIVGQTVKQLDEWMDAHGYSSIESFRGILSQEKIDNPGQWERAQFMRIQQV